MIEYNHWNHLVVYCYWFKGCLISSVSFIHIYNIYRSRFVSANTHVIGFSNGAGQSSVDTDVYYYNNVINKIKRWLQIDELIFLVLRSSIRRRIVFNGILAINNRLTGLVANNYNGVTFFIFFYYLVENFLWEKHQWNSQEKKENYRCIVIVVVIVVIIFVGVLERYIAIRIQR